MATLDELRAAEVKLTERVAANAAVFHASIEEWDRLNRLKLWMRSDRHSLHHLRAEIAARTAKGE